MVEMPTGRNQAMTLARLKLRMYIALLLSSIVFFLFVWGITYLLQAYLPSFQIVSVTSIPLIGLIPFIGQPLEQALIIFINAIMGPLFLPFIITIVFVLMQYLSGPSIVRRVMKLRYLKPGENAWLQGTVQELAQESNLPTPKVAISPMKEANAFTFGRSAKGATLAVTDGLLNTLNESEVRGVVGHELGHIKHKDYLVITILSMLPLLAYMVANVAFNSAYYAPRQSSSSKNNNAGTLIMIAGVLSLFVYFVFNLIVLAVSRTREFLADRFSATTTENPKSLQSALVKISMNLRQSREQTASGARGLGLRAFFIADPLNANEEVEKLKERGMVSDKQIAMTIQAGRQKTGFLSLNAIFATHPPVYRRLENLAEIDEDLRRTHQK
jgi:heat shock protein HtpX